MSKFFLAAALGLVALADGASAQSSDIHVAYADLDLSKPEGVVALDHRITRAVSKICNEKPHVDAFRDLEIRQCAKALTAAVEPQRQRALMLRRPATPLVASTK